MKNRLSLILIIILFISCSTASAQSWLWGEQGTGSLKGGDNTENIVTNKIGNVYYTGSFTDLIIFGTKVLGCKHLFGINI